MAHMRLGRAQAKAAAPAPTKGTKQGNARGNYERQSGHLPNGTSTAERSTGINPKAEEPIAPRMPNPPPAYAMAGRAPPPPPRRAGDPARRPDPGRGASPAVRRRGARAPAGPVRPAGGLGHDAAHAAVD